MTVLAQQDLEQVVRGLPAQDRLILALRYAEELSPTEIAHVMRISRARVEHILTRLRRLAVQHAQQREDAGELQTEAVISAT
ncbi:MAG: sigma factor-like helix-turn-helix DNA-binding protein [Planctomycetota bacterium]